MIGRSEFELGISVIDRTVILPTQLDERVRDNIVTSNATPNPDLLKIKPGVLSLTEPIWESSRSELYASSPGNKRYVIWKYDLDEEGVRKFNPFNSYDPLPHHYYKSNEEYEDARMTYMSGGAPDQLIDINEYDWNISSAFKASEVVVFPEASEQNEPQNKSQAA